MNFLNRSKIDYKLRFIKVQNKISRKKVFEQHQNNGSINFKQYAISELRNIHKNELQKLLKYEIQNNIKDVLRYFRKPIKCKIDY